MSEPNWLVNGRFLGDIGSWTTGGAEYSAGDGDDHYGIAVLSTGGDYIEQGFVVDKSRTYSIHLSVKNTAGLTSGQATARITDGNGNTVSTTNLTGSADTWTENTISIGLVAGVGYALRITNATATGDLKVDDVWVWFVPMTRANMATRVHAKLARLATQRSLNTTPAGSLSEGSYTYAVDSGLRAIGAINEDTGQVDIRYVTDETLQTCLDAIEREMLEQLQRDYAVETDVRIGPRSENLSQVQTAIGNTLSGAKSGASGRVIMRKLSYGDYDSD